MEYRAGFEETTCGAGESRHLTTGPSSGSCHHDVPPSEDGRIGDRTRDRRRDRTRRRTARRPDPPNPADRVRRPVAQVGLLQHAGSFKTRGAFNRVLIEPSVPPSGLIAASGGNHGAAVAYVARQLGLPAEIFIPATSPAIKRANIERFGATAVVVDGLYDEAQLRGEHPPGVQRGAARPPVRPSGDGRRAGNDGA